MSDNRPAPPVDLGIYSRPSGDHPLDRVDRLALILTGIWLFFCVLFVSIAGLGSGSELGALRVLILIMAVALPIALVWIAAIALKSARIIREESNRLQTSMDAMRQIYVSQAQMAATTMGPNVERKIDEIVKGQKRAEDALAGFATTRPRDVARRSAALGPTSVRGSNHQRPAWPCSFHAAGPARNRRCDRRLHYRDELPRNRR